MLEIKEKQNGQYTNKSIKLNDLGMNQSIEFTPKFTKTGEGSFGDWFKVTGTYHSEDGDIEEVTIWAGKGYFPKLESQKDVRCKVTKVKPEGSKFHTYNVEPVSGSSGIGVKKPFELKKQCLKDKEGQMYDEQELLDSIKEDGEFDNLQIYILNWQDYGSTEERAREVFANRK